MFALGKTGQFGVVRTRGFFPWLIRLGTRSQVNHAFVFISETEVIEAEPHGARIRPATEYHHAAIRSNFALNTVQARAVADAARSLKETPYGFLDIVAITLVTLGIRWGWFLKRVQSMKTLICSQLVDRAYTLASAAMAVKGYAHADVTLYDDGRPDGLVTPGDLLMLLAERSTRTARR